MQKNPVRQPALSQNGAKLQTVQRQRLLELAKHLAKSHVGIEKSSEVSWLNCLTISYNSEILSNSLRVVSFFLQLAQKLQPSKQNNQRQNCLKQQ